MSEPLATPEVVDTATPPGTVVTPAPAGEPLHDDPAIAAALVGLTPEQRETLLTTGGQKALAAQREAARQAKAAADAEKARTQAILKAAGIDTGEDDPVKVLEQTRTENQTLRAERDRLRIQTAMTAVARQHGVHDDLTLAILSNNGQLASLDPSDPQFTEQLSGLVAAAAQTDPRLRLAAAIPASSGGDFTGGPNGAPPNLDAEIEAATKARDFKAVIALKRIRSAQTG